ncbi:short-chain dehydrogenase [Oceanicola sp. 22II-s10i]|uniref:SDR family oxidoreductase n=1 Tax=Oceanicola sp. 22II-s10i TaxID=1317116 RepID=UPI000B51FB4B|nr:SDR family oxidoreductase [Oceanicola sp. 22II-s10i]OWU85754.1 short-chain dehydrogenase [Oceanicola sp. 22II-s10i]
MKETVLILGGRSDIGLACAHAFAAEGHPVQLAARNVETLEPARADLALRHSVEVSLHEIDALATGTHGAFAAGLEPAPGIVICAIGALGNQTADEEDHAHAVEVMRANFEGPASLMAVFANQMAVRGEGVLVGISSVAGDRGRAANYIYGSAKAGFTAYLSGLRNRLAKQGVHVVTVKPGFVATSMTEGMDLPPKLTARPEEVGQAVLSAVRKRRNVIYVRPIWRVVMTVICAIPEAVFKKMSI